MSIRFPQIVERDQIFPASFSGKNDVFKSLTFLPCRRYGDTLLYGRVCTPVKRGQEIAELSELKKLFSYIRGWIRNSFTDDVVLKQDPANAKKMVKFWIGPRAKEELVSNSVLLKESRYGKDEWVLEPETTDDNYDRA